MTAANAAAYVVIGLVIIGGCGALAWAVTGWRKATADIDQAVAMVCRPCSWTDTAAPCTCPDKGCTAETCPKRGVRRG